jgi:hypothetical protein
MYKQRLHAIPIIVNAIVAKSFLMDIDSAYIMERMMLGDKHR